MGRAAPRHAAAAGIGGAEIACGIGDRHESGEMGEKSRCRLRKAPSRRDSSSRGTGRPRSPFPPGRGTAGSTRICVGDTCSSKKSATTPARREHRRAQAVKTPFGARPAISSIELQCIPRAISDGCGWRERRPQRPAFGRLATRVARVELCVTIPAASIDGTA